jgi:hypothetical protein
MLPHKHGIVTQFSYHIDNKSLNWLRREFAEIASLWNHTQVGLTVSFLQPACLTLLSPFEGR